MNFGMEEKHKELISIHRAKFVECVDVERLIPSLLATESLGPDDLRQIRSETDQAKVHKLLDLLSDKGQQAFQSLCLALETTYPHILTVMFLGASRPKVTEPATTGLISDSEVEEIGKQNLDTESYSLDLLTSSHKSFGSQGSGRLFSTPSPLSPCEYDLQSGNLALLKAELKLVTHGKDPLHKEVRKTPTERGFTSQRLVMSSGDSALSRIGTLTKQHGVSNSDKSLSSSRDYDWLKYQCDKAMSELQSLRRQHTETVRRCDTAMRDSEFYRLKHKQAVNKLDKQQSDAITLRTCYNDVLEDKHRLEQEVANLQKFRDEDRVEVAELRKHQQVDSEVLNENGNSEAINQMYITTVKKYEAIKDDYDNLRKRYTEVFASRSAAISKFELIQEELVQLKKQYEEIVQERNNVIRERNGLKQQCTAAIHQWDNALRELNEVKEALAKVQQQRDEAMKEINQAMAVRIKATKDLARLTEERNAAVQEYSLVMLERDSVHKEIEKLQEELSDANKKAKTNDQQKKATLEEVETLRREIASALHDRDRALKECNDLREKYGDHVTAREEGGNGRDDLKRDYDNFRREISRKSFSESLERQNSALNGLAAGDILSKTKKEQLDNLDQANQEIERLRKQAEKLQVELTEAQQEGEVSKRRRDWAFSERDKIVLERESIRTLCDKLRRERDRAVSELAEALRDSDDIKKQRNEASKELKELREKIEAQAEKESRMKQLHAIGHNHSRDSAIDADLQEWETETLEFDLGGINNESLGFELAGGKDDPQYPESLIFISNIIKGSIADGKIKVNDTLLRINNVDLTNADKNSVYEAVQNSDGVVNMVVRRRRSIGGRFIQAVQLNISEGREHGITLETGLYISRISQGSAAAKEGNIALGDRIYSVNGKSLEGTNTPEEAVKLLDSSGGEIITLCVVKCLSNPSAPVSSSSSGHNIVENVDGEKSGTSPIKESSSKSTGREPIKKLTNSSSQTEDFHLMNKKQTSCNSQVQQIFSDRAYQKHMREKRSGKSNSRKLEPISPSSASHEVFAELDSVIEHFNKSNGPTKSSKSRRRKEKIQEKNGGTWPRCRAPPFEYVEQCVGTMLNAPKKKERKSIASLTNSPMLLHGMLTKTCEAEDNVLGNQVTSGTLSDQGVSYSLYNSPPTSALAPASVIPTFSSGPFLSSPKSLFRPPPPSTLEKKGVVDGKVTVFNKDQRLSGPVHSSTASSLDSPLDYSVVSANKDVLAYYSNKGKNRPKSSVYPQSDSESLCAVESPIALKPTSLDIQALCTKPLHISSNSMSSAQGLLASPNALNLSPGLSDRLLQHSPAASHSGPQTNILHSTPNGVAYYAIPSSRIHYSHSHPHTTISCTSPTTTSPRYSSPSTISYTSKSGESIISSSIPESPYPDPRAYHRLEGGYLNTSTSTSPYSFSHSPSQSIELYHYHPVPKRLVNKHPHPNLKDESGSYVSFDATSTFPKRTVQRMQTPASQSTTSRSSTSKISTSSIDKVSTSGRSSPSSSFHVEVLNPATSMPVFGENTIDAGLRSVFIEKSSEPLGIQIDCGPHGGIFVSSVSENSLAARAGLKIGDQLLEVCGINMRSATYLLAANVLRQCGNSITMLVQYSPDKYREAIGTSASSSTSSSSSSSDGSPIPTPTPSSSPKSRRSQLKVLELGDKSLILSSKLQHSKTPAGASRIEDHPSTNAALCLEPRKIYLKKMTSNLGISLLGGNAVGIFVHAVEPDSPAGGSNGLRCGDQILEYNGADLRSATAEHAASELAKPAESVCILAQYNYSRYLEIQDQAGDSFYLRAMFDRCGETPDELSFHKDDILYVDNTMLNGISGMWRAWLVSDNGQKRQWGIIPSKYKVEEQLLLKRSLGDLDSDPVSRRGSTSARRSFFRRKKHQRNNSRDSKELASFSDVSINSFSDSGTLLEDNNILSYQRVEKLDYLVLRPVLIVGPLLEAVADKLVQEFPHKFQRYLPEIVHTSVSAIEKALQDNVYLDYRRRGSHFECVTVAAVKEICDKGIHCIIDTSPQSVERLHRLQIYPIVLFIKFKSTKQIREVKDSTFLTEKVSTKAAKEMYEHSLKIESEYKHLISAVIPGGSLAYMCAQIEACVDQEQNKTLWVSAGTI